MDQAFELAEVNIARLLEPLDSPRLADFVAGLEPVNALAEGAPGFVWRLVADDGADATDLRIFEDEWLLVNASVWTSPQLLRDFVYSDGHRAYLKRRREWFEPLGEAVTALWWVPAGHRPTIEEIRDRLAYLREHGPSQFAFRLSDDFSPPEGRQVATVSARQVSSQDMASSQDASSHDTASHETASGHADDREA